MFSDGAYSWLLQNKKKATLSLGPLLSTLNNFGGGEDHNDGGASMSELEICRLNIRVLWCLRADVLLYTLSIDYRLVYAVCQLSFH